MKGMAKMKFGLLMAIALAWPVSLSAQIYLQPPEVELVDKNGVDLMSGSASLQIDMGVIGAGDSVLNLRYLWSGNAVRSSLSNVMVYDIYTGLKGTSEKWTAAANFDGSSYTFLESQPPGSENWVLKRATGATLSLAADGTHLLKLKNGEVRTYGVPGTPGGFAYRGTDLLLSRKLPNGVIWNYQWEIGTYCRPISLTNNFGYKILLEYTGSAQVSAKFLNLAYSATNPVATASISGTINLNNQDSAFYSVNYGLDLRMNDNISVVDTGGRSWFVTGLTGPRRYGQTINPLDSGIAGYPFTVKTPSSISTNLSYTAVSTGDNLGIRSPPPTSATKNGLTYSYNFTGDGLNVGVANVTDTLGRTSQVRYQLYPGPVDSGRFPLSMTDEAGRVTQFTADGYRIRSVTRPEADQTTFDYDSRGNLNLITHKAKVGSGLADLTEASVFPATCANVITCDRPDSVTDRNGRTTNYSYAREHGGILTESFPADAAGIRPVKRYRYAQRYAWILNGSGGYTQAASPVWRKTEERTCRATATVGDACQGGSADEIVTTFDYGPNAGPNNLLLRGMAVLVDGQTLRTCYGYDKAGNKISETSPRAGLGSCP